MTLLQLALLGVRNFQQITQFEFCPGLNFVQGGNGSGKTTLRDALLLSLFAHNPEQGLSLIHRSNPSTCQSAITFKIKNGDVYRLAQDFIKHIRILSRYEPSTQKFIPIEKRKENVLRWLQQVCGGLEGHQIWYTFSLDRSRLPSSLAAQTKIQQAKPVPGPGGLLEPPGSEPALRSGELEGSAVRQKRLQGLKAIAEKAELVYQMEEQLSDAQSRAGVLKRKLSDLNDVDHELEQINQKIGAFIGFEETNEQLQGNVEEFEKKLEERNREYQTLEQDRTLLEYQIDLIPTDPIYRHKTFLAGVLATSLSMGAGLFISISGIYRHLYLLGLLMGLGLIAGSIIVDTRWLSRKKILEEKLNGKLKNMELLEARFRRENSKFFNLLKKTKTESLEAFKEKVNAYDLLSATHQRLLEERKRVLEGKEPQALHQEYEEKSGLVKELESKIHNYQDIPQDLPSLYEEIRALEKECAAERQTPLAQGRYGPFKPSGRADTPLGFDNDLHDPIGALLQDPLVKDHRMVFSTAREIFIKLSFGSYRDMIMGGSSNSEELLSLLPKDSSSPVSVKELSSGTQDLVFLSLYLSTLMNLGSEHPFPLLLDEALLTLDQQRQEIILEVVREVSQKRQVIIMSHIPYPIREGERKIRLI